MSGSKIFLTAQQFAEKAGVSASTVTKWLRMDKIEGQKKSGKWMISSTELSKVTSPTPSGIEISLKSSALDSSDDSENRSMVEAYTIEEFSDMTYLTEYGVHKWLKEGRLISVTDGSGGLQVSSSNLDKPIIKRLLR